MLYLDVNCVIKKTANGEKKSKDARKQTGIKIDIIENKMNQNKISGPIVIPSSVRTSGKTSAKVSKEKKPITKTVDISQVKNETTKLCLCLSVSCSFHLNTLPCHVHAYACV